MQRPEIEALCSLFGNITLLELEQMCKNNANIRQVILALKEEKDVTR